VGAGAVREAWESELQLRFFANACPDNNGPQAPLFTYLSCYPHMIRNESFSVALRTSLS